MNKKILHVITGLAGGGAESVLFRLCQHSGNDTQHVVVSLGDAGVYGSGLRSQGVTVYCLEMQPSLYSLWKLFLLVKIIRNERPDVVQTWMYHADFFGGIAARLAGIKYIFWGIRRSNFVDEVLSMTARVIAKLNAIFSYFVPAKIICCAHQAKLSHQRMGYCAKKMIVIHNGYDFSKFYPDESARKTIRDGFGIKENEFVMGMVARFNPCKDHENMLNALAILRGEISFKFIFVGDGLPNNAFLIEQIARLGLAENVELMGFSENVPAIMNALDLHVLSSSSEGFPNVLAEAMACGTPAISTEVGDAKVILGDGALCCAPRDPAALADLIVRQEEEWRNASNWSKRKIACAQRIREEFSMKRMVDKYESVWFSEA